MDKLFAALRERHKGYEVVDIRFLTNQIEDADDGEEELDDQFARAVKVAERADIASISS